MSDFLKASPSNMKITTWCMYTTSIVYSNYDKRKAEKEEIFPSGISK